MGAGGSKVQYYYYYNGHIVRVKRTRKSIDDSLKVLNLQEEENHIMASWMPLMASLTAAVNETLTAASTRTCDVV